MTRKPDSNEDALNCPDPLLEVVDMDRLESDFLATIDEEEMTYLRSMGITINQDDEDNNSTNSLYHAVISLNRSLKSSITATLCLFRKSIVRLNGNEPEKRFPRKGSQVRRHKNENLTFVGRTIRL